MAKLCFLCEQNLLNQGMFILFCTLVPVLRYASSDSHPNFKPFLLLWCSKSTCWRRIKKNAPPPPEIYLCYFTVSKSHSTLPAVCAAAKLEHTVEHWASRAYLKAIGQCPHGGEGRSSVYALKTWKQSKTSQYTLPQKYCKILFCLTFDQPRTDEWSQKTHFFMYISGQCGKKRSYCLWYIL